MVRADKKDLIILSSPLIWWVKRVVGPPAAQTSALPVVEYFCIPRGLSVTYVLVGVTGCSRGIA